MFFSGCNFSDKNDLSKNDNNKIYKINSPNGEIKGFMSLKKVSCGEFPSDICQHIQYNLIIRDKLNLHKGVIRFNNIIRDSGSMMPMNCKENIDIAILDPFREYNSNPFDCEINKSEINSYFISHLESYSQNEDYNDPANSKSIEIFDENNSERNKIKTYPINISEQ